MRDNFDLSQIKSDEGIEKLKRMQIDGLFKDKPDVERMQVQKVISDWHWEKEKQKTNSISNTRTGETKGKAISEAKTPATSS